MAKKSTSIVKLHDRIKSMQRSNRVKMQRVKEGGLIETGIGSLFGFGIGAAEAHGYSMPTVGPVDTLLPLGVVSGAIAMNTKGGVAAVAAGVAQSALTIWSYKAGRKQASGASPTGEISKPSEPSDSAQTPAGYDDEFDY
jgi:hypothetical protein